MQIFCYLRQGFFVFRNKHAQYILTIKNIIIHIHMHIYMEHLFATYIILYLFITRASVLSNNGYVLCSVYHLTTCSGLVIGSSVNYENWTGVFMFSFISIGTYPFVCLIRDYSAFNIERVKIYKKVSVYPRKWCVFLTKWENSIKR